MGKVRDGIRSLASEPEIIVDAAYLTFGTMLVTASLATLPGPGYTLSENILRTIGTATGIPSGSMLVYYPIKGAVDDYRRIPADQKPHKIIQRKFKNAYYRMRGMETI
jgi:hypothetical protein